MKNLSYFFDSKYFAFILFTIIFFIGYAPFVIYAFFPTFNWDSNAYFLVAMSVIDKNVTYEYFTQDLPIGLPLIIALVYSLGGNITTIIWIQIILLYISSLFLIYSLYKVDKLSAFFGSILIGGLLITSDYITYTTSILTETYFISFSFIVYSLIILVFREKRNKYLYLLIFVSILPLYFRTNGFVFLIIPFVIFAILLLRKKNKIFKVSISVFLLSLIINMSLNFFVKKVFTLGDTIRLLEILGYVEVNPYRVVKPPSPDRFEDDYNITKISRKQIFIKNFINFANHKSGNFYYYRLPKAYYEFGKEQLVNYILETDVLRDYYAKKISLDRYTNFVYSNIDCVKHKEKYNFERIDIEYRPRNPLIFINHIFHLSDKIIKNYFVIILFWLIFVTLILKYLRVFKINFVENEMLLMSLILFFIMNMTLLVLLKASLSRYCHPFEFIYLIVISIFLPNLIRNFKTKRLASQ